MYRFSTIRHLLGRVAVTYPLTAAIHAQLICANTRHKLVCTLKKCSSVGDVDGRARYLCTESRIKPSGKLRSSDTSRNYDRALLSFTLNNRKWSFHTKGQVGFRDLFLFLYKIHFLKISLLRHSWNISRLRATTEANTTYKPRKRMPPNYKYQEQQYLTVI